MGLLFCGREARNGAGDANDLVFGVDERHLQIADGNLVVTELGRTRDNLKSTAAALDSKPVPPGGKQVLAELMERARAAGLDDLDFGPDPYDKPPVEPLDVGTAGIGALLVISSIAGVALAVLAVVMGLRAIFSTGG